MRYARCCAVRPTARHRAMNPSTPRSAFLARLTLEPSRPRLIARGLAGGGGGPSRAAAHPSRRRMVRSAARAVGGRIGPRVVSTRRRAVGTPRAPPRPPRRQARILVVRRHQSRRQTPSGGPAICGTIRSRRSGYAWIRRARAGVCASRRSTTTLYGTPPPTTRLRASSRSSLARRSSVTVTRQVDPRRSVMTRSVFAEYSYRYAEGSACGLRRLRLGLRDADARRSDARSRRRVRRAGCAESETTCAVVYITKPRILT